MTTHILVPVDFSEASERALAWAADLARKLSGTVMIAHYVPLADVAVTAAAVWPGPTDEEIEELRDHLVELARRHHIDGARVHVAVTDDVAHGILRSARDAGCDLIVMSTHGRGGWKRVMMGGIADYTCRHARCPVVTVRDRPMDDAPHDDPAVASVAAGGTGDAPRRES